MSTPFADGLRGLALAHPAEGTGRSCPRLPGGPLGFGPYKGEKAMPAPPQQSGV